MTAAVTNSGVWMMAAALIVSAVTAALYAVTCEPSRHTHTHRPPPTMRCRHGAEAPILCELCHAERLVDR